MKKMMIIIMLFGVSSPCFPIALFTEYMNSNAMSLMKHAVGIGTTFKWWGIPLTMGIEHLSIQQTGTVHSPNQKNMITSQEQLAIPLGLYWRFTPIQKLSIQPIIGIKFFSTLSINTNEIDAIETKTTMLGQPIISDYSETLHPSLFYKLQLSIHGWKNWTVSFAKTWSTIISTSSFTYLNAFKTSKKSQYNYDPISIAIAYHF